MIDEPRGTSTCGSSTLSVFVDCDPFHGLLLTVLGPVAISIVVEPQGAFTCRSSTHAFWSIVTRFVDYYSPFWGPIVISIVTEPQGAHMCRSSTITVLADSGPFRGLLLTVLGSRSDVHE